MGLTEREKAIIQEAARESAKEVIERTITDNSNVWVKRNQAMELLNCGRKTLEKLKDANDIKWRQGDYENSAIEYNVQSILDYNRSKNYGLSQINRKKK